MLTVGDNRRARARGTVSVSEPPYGFFIAGSSMKAMNGVYVRCNPRRDSERQVAYDYSHEDNVWHMSLVAAPRDAAKEAAAAAAEEAAEAAARARYGSYGYDDYDFGGRSRRAKPAAEWQWVFIDGTGRDRFSHEGDTIVPGAGKRWTHVARDAAARAGAGAGADAGADDEGVLDASGDEDGESESETESDEGSDYDDEDAAAERLERHMARVERRIARAQASAAGASARAVARVAALQARAARMAVAAAAVAASAARGATAIVPAAPDDPEELPWQVTTPQRLQGEGRHQCGAVAW